jgi:phage/plasmid-associated DNA primase
MLKSLQNLLSIPEIILLRDSWIIKCSGILEEPQFDKADLYGKLANIADELTPSALKTTATIKQLTGGSAISAREIYKKRFPFVNYAKQIFACNAIPPTPDDTEAFFRRWTQVAFTRIFGADNPDTDPTLKDKITTPEVSEAMLSWAIDGLKRLLKTNKFTFTKSMDETREQYIRATNPTAAFALDNLEKDLDSKIARDYTFKCYMDYCRKMKLPTQSRRTFEENLRAVQEIELTLIYTFDKGQRNSYWGGVKFSKESPYNDPNASSTNNFAHETKSGMSLEEINTTITHTNSVPLVGLAKKDEPCKTEKIEAETQPEASILPTNPYAGKIIEKVKKEDEMPSFREFTDEDAPNSEE